VGQIRPAAISFLYTAAAGRRVNCLLEPGIQALRGREPGMSPNGDMAPWLWHGGWSPGVALPAVTEGASDSRRLWPPTPVQRG
jgi:hypothetical protein